MAPRLQRRQNRHIRYQIMYMRFAKWEVNAYRQQDKLHAAEAAAAKARLLPCVLCDSCRHERPFILRQAAAKLRAAEAAAEEARDSEARTLRAAVELRQQVQEEVTQMRVRATALLAAAYQGALTSMAWPW